MGRFSKRQMSKVCPNICSRFVRSPNKERKLSILWQHCAGKQQEDFDLQAQDFKVKKMQLESLPK